jgi:hypothetical protein
MCRTSRTGLHVAESKRVPVVLRCRRVEEMLGGRYSSISVPSRPGDVYLGALATLLFEAEMRDLIAKRWA